MEDHQETLEVRVRTWKYSGWRQWQNHSHIVVIKTTGPCPKSHTELSSSWRRLYYYYLRLEHCFATCQLSNFLIKRSLQDFMAVSIFQEGMFCQAPLDALHNLNNHSYPVKAKPMDNQKLPGWQYLGNESPSFCQFQSVLLLFLQFPFLTLL